MSYKQQMNTIKQDKFFISITTKTTVFKAAA